jgi:hypothetical protein
MRLLAVAAAGTLMVALGGVGAAIFFLVTTIPNQPG